MSSGDFGDQRGRVRSSNGPEMRSTSFTGHVPALIAMTKRSPATPARRASGVAGAKTRLRGTSPSVKLANLIRLPSGRQDEDLLLVAIGHEHGASGADAERGDHRPAVDDLGGALRRDAYDLAGPLLIGRFGAAVAADPQLIALVDREQARTRELHECWIEQTALGIEADDDALGAIRDVEISRRVDGRRFRLSQNRSSAPLGRTAREQLGPSVDHAIEAHRPSAHDRTSSRRARARAGSRRLAG